MYRYKLKYKVVDPTFCLGDSDITPATYPHLVLECKRTGQPPAMIGPTLIHYRNTFASYLFFASSMVAGDWTASRAINTHFIKYGCTKGPPQHHDSPNEPQPLKQDTGRIQHSVHQITPESLKYRQQWAIIMPSLALLKDIYWLTLSTKLTLASWKVVTRLWLSPFKWDSLRIYTSLAYAMATASRPLLPCILNGVVCITWRKARDGIENVSHIQGSVSTYHTRASLGTSHLGVRELCPS